MRTFKPTVILAALLAAVGLLAPGSSSGQPLDLDTPASSPLWWTLSDEISPAELRSALRSPEAHRERYLAAVDAGIAQPLAEDQVQALSFYYNRRLTPELTPMWFAFDVFGTAHLQGRGEEHVTGALAEFGFAPSAIATILELGRSQAERSQELSVALGKKSIQFVQIQRRAIEARGGDRRSYALVKRAAERGELGLLLGSTDVSLETLSELRAAWLRHPITEIAEDLLPELRSRLSAEDWEGFRRFLLEHVVPAMGSESRDFDYAKGVE